MPRCAAILYSPGMVAMPATLFDIPGATLAALLIAAAVRWAYGSGPGSGNCRAWPLTFLVAALAAFVVWRILQWQSGVLTVLDATAGILCGILLMQAIKAAWADGPFDRMPMGLYGRHENTPMGVLIIAGVFALGILAFSFGCVGSVLFVCEPDGDRFLVWGYVPALPPGGLRVDMLPPGDWQ